MRSSVVAISSVNASFNALSRNPHIDESELELYHYYTTAALDTPPVEVGGPLTFHSARGLTHSTGPFKDRQSTEL